MSNNVDRRTAARIHGLVSKLLLPSWYVREQGGLAPSLFADHLEDLMARRAFGRVLRMIVLESVAMVRASLEFHLEARPEKNGRKGSIIGALVQDLKYAIRGVLRQPTYGLMIVLIMTL